MKKKANVDYQDIASRIYYVYCELEYRGHKRGSRLLSAIGRIEGVLETQLLKEGVIRITGEFDLDRLLCFVGDNVRIKSLQKGKCFSILYGPEPAKKQTAGGNTNNRSSIHPTYYDQSACYGVPYGYSGGNGYPNYYTQPRIFGNHQLLLEENREGEEVEKPVSPQNAEVKKSRKSEAVGGCCLM